MASIRQRVQKREYLRDHFARRLVHPVRARAGKPLHESGRAKYPAHPAAYGRKVVLAHAFVVEHEQGNEAAQRFAVNRVGEIAEVEHILLPRRSCAHSEQAFQLLREHLLL